MPPEMWAPATGCWVRNTEAFLLCSFRVFENEDFVKSLTALAKKARCKLTVCPLEESREDQWMQVRGPVG